MVKSNTIYRYVILLIIMVISVCPVTVFAQALSGTPITDNKRNIPILIDSSEKKDDKPLKTEILRISTGHEPGNIIHADNIIRVTVSNPKGLLSQRPSDNSQLMLYAEGFPLKGMITSYYSEMSSQDMNNRLWPDTLDIPFVFKKDSTNKDAWNRLFHMAHWNQNKIKFKLSIGWSGMFPINYAKSIKPNTKLTLVFYESRVFYILLLLYVCFIVLFILVCHKTGLIRDPDNIGHLPGPYSLAQTQLAFWTVIVIGGFGYLILLTGLSDSLNDSILMLLGISGGTTGLASFIDYYKKKTVSTVAAATGTPVQSISIKMHRSFLEDILSDGTNLSVQRTQVVLWNFVLGVYFIWYVINNKSMPVFDNTLLILAGVSSVLYLSSKGPENPPAISPSSHEPTAIISPPSETPAQK
ncbi:MAG: hypothetical protein JWR05_1660 [Mucilaginibacter sp.]|nr:hypothetical protein [Mucilaginibacter sp.]